MVDGTIRSKSERIRENNFDCLRVYCMFMVILNHVADIHLLKMGWTTSNIIVYLFEGISHCAVPIFLMITGAFLLDQMPKISSKAFYIKSFKKLGIPTLFFMLVYWIFDYICGRKSILDILNTFITGCAGAYAHWYVFM